MVLKKKFALCAAAFLTAVGCTTASLSLSAAPLVFAENDAAVEENTSSEPVADVPMTETVTEESALAQMKEYARTEKLSLYLNEETLTFALKNNENGFVWWSTPYNVEDDQIANELQKSILRSSLLFNQNTKQATNLNTYSSSVKTKRFKLEPIENGFKATFTLGFTDEDVDVYLLVYLDGDRLSVEMPIKDIVEADTLNSSLITTTLLPSFGAADLEDSGYFVVPDGSGAVIEFNSPNYASYQDYAAQLYGSDDAIGKLYAEGNYQTASLPVYGIVKDKNALVVVAEEGDAQATLRSSQSRKNNTSFNMAYFEFLLRSSDNYKIGNRSDLTVVENGKIKLENIKVSYYPISGDNVSYVDVADTYRDYLINEKGLTKKADSGTAPMGITLLGGENMKRSVVGIPVNVQTAATTFDQAKEILTLLKENGVDSMMALYDDFSKAGITMRIPSSADYASVLGGKKDFTALLDYCAQSNVRLAPSVEIMEFKRSGNGYSLTNNAAFRITKSYAIQLPFERAFGTEDLDRETWSIMSPVYFSEILGKVSDSFVKDGIDSISLGNATTKLYSDFGTKEVSREKAKNLLAQSYAQMKEKGLYIVADGANGYALPYADFIADIPTSSSKYDTVSYDIPFYQMVIHGYIPYTTTAINKSADSDRDLLLAIASGSQIHYDFMYENPNLFATSDYEKYFYANYAGWIEKAAGEYKLVRDLIAPVSDQKIVGYEMLSRDEIKTTYENGTETYVNLKTLEIKINGVSVNYGDYGLKGDEING